MTTQTFTAPGVLTHAHAGGSLSIQSAGGKGGVMPMFLPTGATRATAIRKQHGSRVVNGPKVDLPAGTVSVYVNAHSGVSVDYPIEVTIASF